MDLIYKNITSFFDEIISDINCHPDTRAYIVSIYAKYKSSEFDLSKHSVSLEFAQARSKHDFFIYQNLGDWIFFSNTTNPQHLKFASKEYYDTVARLSYYSCYKLINKKWKLFEELADNLPNIEDQVKNKLNELNFNNKIYQDK